jgi:hypothetical protein
MAFAVLLCLAAGIADGQTVDDAQLVVTPHLLTTNGAENPEHVSGRWATTVGKSTSMVFSMSGCGNFTVSSGSQAKVVDDATYGWRVELTPAKVVDHATTFRLRWARVVDRATKDPSSASEDVELTLKPGESRPIDSVAVPQDGKTLNGRPCDIKSASLRVSSEFSDFDSRRIAADLWLVEKLPTGIETRQSFAVVGTPHQPMSFYFDRIGDVDLFGHLVGDPLQSTIKVDVEIVRAQVDVPPPADTHGYRAARWDHSTTHVTTDEVIEIPLPKLEERFGPYATREFALRIKVRRLR